MKSWVSGFAIVFVASAVLGCTTNESTDQPSQDDNTGTTATTVVEPTTTQLETTTTTTTTVPVVDPTTPEDSSTTTTTLSLAGSGTGDPPPPENVTCLAGTNEGELLIEWDAPSSTVNVNRVRLYVSVDGQPFRNNRTIPLTDVDTTRDNGNRWAATVSSVPDNVPLRIAVTTFNLIEKESGWYPISAHYTGPGEPCGSGIIPTATTSTTTTIIPTTGTAGNN